VVQLLLFGAVDVVVGGSVVDMVASVELIKVAGSVVVLSASIERRVGGASFVVDSCVGIAVGGSVVDVGASAVVVDLSASVVDVVVCDSVDDIVFYSCIRMSCLCFCGLFCLHQW
jgi:hypothetical protein